MEEKAFKTHQSTTDELKAFANRALRSMSKGFVIKVCKRFRPWYDRVVAAKAGRIERLWVLRYRYVTKVV